MKMKIFMISILCVAATALPVTAQTVAYSFNGTPQFSVSMPDGWRFESKPNPRNPEAKRISGVASKGLVWFGVWVVKDAKTVDDAYKYVQATARTLITDAKETKAPATAQLNGMKAKYSEHSGTMKMEDGKSQLFNAQVYLFQTKSGRVGIAVCLSDTDGQTSEKANIDAFFKSLKPIK
ncbi:MAG TPA: hypothetical protein VJV05_16415 [Pyrinomonadaceae bacterium]|nr:hypothetical protein [Pyrinomonadaceae bacterium]